MSLPKSEDVFRLAGLNPESFYFGRRLRFKLKDQSWLEVTVTGLNVQGRSLAVYLSPDHDEHCAIFKTRPMILHDYHCGWEYWPKSNEDIQPTEVQFL